MEGCKEPILPIRSGCVFGTPPRLALGLLANRQSAGASLVLTRKETRRRSLDELRLMPTTKQDLGKRGEKAVCQHVSCPRCGRERQLRPLPVNFECVDVICKFCGFLAQVKATTGGSAEDRQTAHHRPCPAVRGGRNTNASSLASFIRSTSQPSQGDLCCVSTTFRLTCSGLKRSPTRARLSRFRQTATPHCTRGYERRPSARSPSSRSTAARGRS